MFNELTEVDIKKMQEEIEYRDTILRAEIVQNLKDDKNVELQPLNGVENGDEV